MWDNREDIFTPEAAAAIRAKVEERTVLVFPQIDLSDEEQLRVTDLMGGKVRITARNNVQTIDEDVYQVTLDEKILAGVANGESGGVWRWSLRP